MSASPIGSSNPWGSSRGKTSLTARDLETNPKKEIHLNASAILRKVHDLDKLERRLRTLTHPSETLLKQIDTERNNLLNGVYTNETLPSIQTTQRTPVQK